MSGKRDGLLRAAVMISVLTILARVAGFARVAVFSASVGASDVGNAYNTVNALPNVVYEVAVGGAMAGAVIPLLAGPLARAAKLGRQPEEASTIASALLTWTLAVLTPLAIALALAAGPIARALIPDAGSASLGAQLLVVFAPQVVLYGISVVLAGLLQAGRRFFLPALAPLLSSLVVMAAYAAFRVATAGQSLGDPAQVASQAVTWLGWGTTAGVAALSLPLFIPAYRAGIRLRFTLRFPPGTARRALRLVTAGLGAVMAQQLAVVVVLIASNHFGGPSAQTQYGYMQACYLLAFAVLAQPLITSAFPRQAELAGSLHTGMFGAMAARTLRGVTVAGLFGAAVLMGIAPAIQRVFGAVDRGDVTVMGRALPYFAPGVLGLAIMMAASRGLYALEKGRAAGAVTAAGWLVMSLGIGAGVWWVLPGTGDRPAMTLIVVGASFSVGMMLAAAGGLWALAATAGLGALAGLARTGIAGLAGATVGVVAARLVVSLGRGEGVWAALALGLAGALAVALAMVAAILAGDRGLVAAMRREQQEA